MKKLFITLLFSCSLFGQEHELLSEFYNAFEEVESTANKLIGNHESFPTRTIYFEATSGNGWVSRRAELDNGDIVTYTKMRICSAPTVACIYARKEQGNFETRYSASREWIEFMENYPNKQIPVLPLRR